MWYYTNNKEADLSMHLHSLIKPMLISTTAIILFVWFDSLRPTNKLSVKQRWVFLGWTSTKLG